MEVCFFVVIKRYFIYANMSTVFLYGKIAIAITFTSYRASDLVQSDIFYHLWSLEITDY